MEDKHRCKLCSRKFSNGRALGGHMRSHLATLPLPRKTVTLPTPPPLTQLNHHPLVQKTESDSASSCTEQEIEEQKALAFAYKFRVNPKRSLKLSDPEFLDSGSDSVVIQDRESHAESLQNNPTRRRSKRTQTHPKQQFLSKSKKPKLLSFKVDNIMTSESVTESIQVSSVASDSFLQDEQVALCLMMLSRDVWEQRVKENDDEDSVELTRSEREFKCLACKKVFRSNRALGGHRATSKMCQENAGEDDEFEPKIYECPFCYKVFGSGQALGGHKRSHLLGSSNDASSNAHPIHIHSHEAGESLIDLNLPAPIDEDR